MAVLRRSFLPTIFLALVLVAGRGEFALAFAAADDTRHCGTIQVTCDVCSKGACAQLCGASLVVVGYALDRPHAGTGPAGSESPLVTARQDRLERARGPPRHSPQT